MTFTPSEKALVFAGMPEVSHVLREIVTIPAQTFGIYTLRDKAARLVMFDNPLLQKVFMTQIQPHKADEALAANPLFPLSPKGVRALLARSEQSAPAQKEAA